ncbi:MAG: hypothetical protein DRG78_08330 [Epsilonproteobacteria bacterium]|nr:MAG: hypothetical protein DRG78_08330 [Campylobacterota bacterium]
MEDLIVSNEDLKEMFKKGELKDMPNGWYYNNFEVEIIAIHKLESKHITDITHAEFYKLKKIKNNNNYNDIRY